MIQGDKGTASSWKTLTRIPTKVSPGDVGFICHRSDASGLDDGQARYTNGKEASRTEKPIFFVSPLLLRPSSLGALSNVNCRKVGNGKVNPL